MNTRWGTAWPRLFLLGVILTASASLRMTVAVPTSALGQLDDTDVVSSPPPAETPEFLALWTEVFTGTKTDTGNCAFSIEFYHAADDDTSRFGWVSALDYSSCQIEVAIVIPEYLPRPDLSNGVVEESFASDLPATQATSGSNLRNGAGGAVEAPPRLQQSLSLDHAAFSPGHPMTPSSIPSQHHSTWESQATEYAAHEDPADIKATQVIASVRAFMDAQHSYFVGKQAHHQRYFLSYMGWQIDTATPYWKATSITGDSTYARAAMYGHFYDYDFL